MTLSGLHLFYMNLCISRSRSANVEMEQFAVVSSQGIVEAVTNWSHLSHSGSVSDPFSPYHVVSRVADYDIFRLLLCSKNLAVLEFIQPKLSLQCHNEVIAL